MSWANFPDQDGFPTVPPTNNIPPPAKNSSSNTPNNSDPWSSEAWGDQTDALLFSPSFPSSASDPFDMDLELFPTKSQDPAVVHVAIHEQLSSLFDGEQTPESQVIGSIHVRCEPALEGRSFCLTVKDPDKQLQQLQQEKKVCCDVTGSNSEGTALRVTVPPTSSGQEQVTIANYQCGTSVRPIPLLVKSRVNISQNHVRVGIRMRANPSNPTSLEGGAILLAVPPDVKGESVQTSRKGSVWDGMKRIVAWPLDPLPPGQVLEIQAQFEFLVESRGVIPKFPVLVRCDSANQQFSNVELSTEETGVTLEVSRSVRVLHRNV